MAGAPGGSEVGAQERVRMSEKSGIVLADVHRRGIGNCYFGPHGKPAACFVPALGNCLCQLTLQSRFGSSNDFPLSHPNATLFVSSTPAALRQRA